MKSQALQRVTSLVIAIALVMIDANIICAQQDVDPAPAASGAQVNPTKKVVTHANATVMKPSLVPVKPNTPPAGKTAAVGKTTVKQASATKQATAPRTPIQGTENTKTGSKPPVVQEKKTIPEKSIAEKTIPEKTVPTTSTGTGSAIKQVGFEESTKGINADGIDPLLLEQKKRFQPGPSATMTPPAMGNAPAVLGAYCGLRPGEAASEALIRVQTALANFERENQELRQQHAQLQAKLKESHEQLLAAVREIQIARKEVTTARVDLDRLKGEVQSLREKARSSEKEHESLLRSMGPLLQQLLEGSEVSALPPNPPE